MHLPGYQTDALEHSDPGLRIRWRIRLGLAFLAGGAILLAGGWDVHPNLNQNDLFHLALLPTLFFWAQAGKQFEDR